MSSFDALCNLLEDMDPETFDQVFNEKSVAVVTQLVNLTADGKSGINAYLNFILAAVAADGNLAKKEFELLKPTFDQMAGKDVTYDEAVKMFNDMGLNKADALKDAADTMADVIGLLSEDIKDDIVMLCLLVCSIDGKISEKEKEWIKQLIEPLTIKVTPMEFIDGFLDQAGVFTLATTCGDQPRMRILGLKIVLDGKIYFAVGTFKDVYKQLQANPKCEILASVDEDFLRWDGVATFKDDDRFMPIVKEMLPELVQMYEQMGWKLGFFTLEGGCAEIVSVNNEKKKIF